MRKPTEGKCFHGLGHGPMFFSENDLESSLRYCKTLSEGFQRIQCAEGVFMENFETGESVHPSASLHADNPFFPCRAQQDPYKGVCAFYAPRSYIAKHPGDYAGALQWCERVPTVSRSACIKGVGSVAMKEHIDEPLLSERVCDGADASERRYCIEGFVSYRTVRFASVSKGRELCAMLQPGNRASCENIAQESMPFFQD